MSQNKFPKGWDNEKVQRILAQYEGQTEEEALMEDEEGIPHKLLPEVRELITRYQRAESAG